MTISYRTDHGLEPVIASVQASEANSQQALSTYGARIEHEFIEGSAIAPSLYKAAVSIHSDVEVLSGGEVTYPIHDALNWRITRFGHQARPNQYAAFLHNEDASVWQAKLSDPLRDRNKDKPRKYETPIGNGSRAYFPAIDTQTRNTIAERHGCDIPDGLFWEWLRETTLPIIITEGAKKALSLLSQGYIAIALYGVTGGYRTKDQLGNPITPQLIPDLRPFCTPQRLITLAFDQDIKEKTRKKVERAINKFGALIEKQGCNLNVATWDKHQGKGADDLIVNQGAQAWDTAYDMALPLSLWKIAERLSNQLTYEPDLLLNSPDLATLVLAGLPLEGIIAIASAKGTGKTKYIGALLSDTEKALLATHRIALTRHLCHRLGMNYRGDLDKANGEFFTDGAYALRVGFCVDSFLSINPRTFQGCDLIIDEVVQVLRHLLTSSTCNQQGKRPALLARFRQILQAAKRIIVADADLDDATLDYLRTLRGEDACFLIRNDYKPKGFSVHMLDTTDRSVICQRLLEDIRQLSLGKVLYIATDSKRNSKTLLQLINGACPEKRVLLINSETSGGADEQEFINTPDQVLRRGDYDVIVCSPSVATGTSIEIQGVIEKVYGVFMGVSSNDADMAQALARVREPVQRVLWCAAKGRNYCKVSRATNPIQLKGHLHERTTVTASLVRLSLREDTQLQLRQIQWQDDPHIHLYAQISAAQNLSMMSLRDALQVRLRLEGNQVHVEHFESNEGMREMLKHAGDTVKLASAQAIFNAEDLSYSEVLLLEHQEALAPAQHHAIQKYYLKDFYRLDELTVEDILADRDGRRRGEMLNLEAQLYPEVALDRTVKRLEKQASWRQHLCPWDISGTAVRREIRDRLGLTDLIRKAADGLEWNKADLVAIAKTAREFAPAIKAHLNITVSEALSDVQVVHQLLSQMGIKVGFRWSTKTKEFPGDKVRVYSLETEPWGVCAALLERRAQHRKSLSEGGSPPSVINIKTAGDLPENNGPEPETVDSSLGQPVLASESVIALPLWEAQAG